MKINIMLFGGRGATSSIPTTTPGGGGGGSGTDGPMDQNPGSPDTLSEALGEKGRPMSTYDAIMKANPFWDGSYREYTENCQRAVIAAEARFRGYDVIAQPTYEGDDLPKGGNWLNAFKNAKSVDVGRSTEKATIKAIENQMGDWGNNSRGILRVVWKGKNAEGHVLNVVHRSGKTYYLDGQVGKQYTAQGLMNSIRTKDTKLVRVDNLDFGDRAKEAVRQNPYK